MWILQKYIFKMGRVVWTSSAKVFLSTLRSYLDPSWHNTLTGGHRWGHLPLHYHVRSFCIPLLAWSSEFPIYILIIWFKLLRRTGVNVDWFHVIPDFGLNRSPLWSRFNYFWIICVRFFVLLRAEDATSMWCSPRTPALVSRSWTIRWDINFLQACGNC